MASLKSTKGASARHRELQHWAQQLAMAKRILVLGSSGAGKTYFSRRLGEALGIEPIHLDALFWQTGWISTAEDKWRNLVGSLLQRPAWIMDGTYERTLDLRLAAADMVISVESSRLACLWRVLKRRFSSGDSKRPDAPSRQPIDRAFLLYIWRYPVVTRLTVIDLVRQYGQELITLRTGEIGRLLDYVRGHTAGLEPVQDHS